MAQVQSFCHLGGPPKKLKVHELTQKVSLLIYSISSTLYLVDSPKETRKHPGKAIWFLSALLSQKTPPENSVPNSNKSNKDPFKKKMSNESRSPDPLVAWFGASDAKGAFPIWLQKKQGFNPKPPI